MTEVTHADIINRVSALEGQQAEMSAQLRLVQIDTGKAVLGVEENRKHFDEQLSALKDNTDKTSRMLETHVVQVETTHKTIIAMFKGMFALVAFVATLLGLIEAMAK